MRPKLKAVAVLPVVILLSGGTDKDPFTLDLAAPGVREVLEMSRGCNLVRPTGGSLHHPRAKPELSLRLEIVKLNGTDFKFGEYLTAQLRLTNVGEKDVMIPWDTHAEVVYGPKCEWPKEPMAIGFRGMIAVDLVSMNGQTGQTATVNLFGISTNRDSYRKLVPGKSAVMKVSGRIYIAPPDPSRPGDWGKREYTESFAAYAVFNLDNSSLWDRYETLRSTNEIHINVTIPKAFITH